VVVLGSELRSQPNPTQNRRGAASYTTPGDTTPWHVQVAGDVPAGPIHDQGGVLVRGQRAGELVEEHLHRPRRDTR
jgi:hypothetical protein